MLFNFFSANSCVRFCFFIVDFGFLLWLFICLRHNFVGFFKKGKNFLAEFFMFLYFGFSFIYYLEVTKIRFLVEFIIVIVVNKSVFGNPVSDFPPLCSVLCFGIPGY